jgi:mono/diheme cytochrome c family protein
MKPLFALITLFFALILLAACSSQPQPAQSVPVAADVGEFPPLDPDLVTLGETVYAENCAECHGASLEGEPEWKVQNEDGSFRAPPHNADGHTWHHDDALLTEAIQQGGARFDGLNVGGTSNMPAFAENLTDEEITAGLAYIKSSWPDDLRQAQWQVTVNSLQQ